VIFLKFLAPTIKLCITSPWVSPPLLVLIKSYQTFGKLIDHNPRERSNIAKCIDHAIRDVMFAMESAWRPYLISLKLWVHGIAAQNFGNCL